MIYGSLLEMIEKGREHLGSGTSGTQNEKNSGVRKNGLDLLLGIPEFIEISPYGPMPIPFFRNDSYEDSDPGTDHQDFFNLQE